MSRQSSFEGVVIRVLLPLLAIASGLCVLVGAVSAPKAGAFTVTSALDPLENAICYTGACTAAPDLSGLVRGGDGSSISSWFIHETEIGFSDPAGAAIEADSPQVIDGLAVGLGLLDAPVTIPLLGGAALALGASDIIKHLREGSTTSSVYVSLDLSLSSPLLTNGAVSIGPYIGNLSQSATNGAFLGSLGITGPGSQWWSKPNNLADGYYLSPTAAKATYEAWYGTSTGDLMYNDAQVFWANQARMTVVDMSNAFSGSIHPCPTQYRPCYMSYFTPAQYDAAFHVATQPWSGQTVSGTYGWANQSSGAGLEPQGGTTLVPAPGSLSGSNPTTVCLTSGGVRTCGAGSGSVDIPFQGLTLPSRNYIRCVADPADFICPTPKPDGTGWQNSGGSTWTMPDCSGYLVVDCESLIDSAASGADQATPSFGVTTVDAGAQVDSTLPGAALDQSVASGSVGAPSSITFDANPDPMNGYSSSGGYGGSGGPPIAPPDEQCSFEEWGSSTWDAVRNEDPSFYDQACQDAWQAASDAGFIDDLGQPSSSWWSSAEIAIRGKYLLDESAIEALTSDGSSITDWAKVKSPQFETANGEAELHAYKNLSTGAFNSYDFKVVFVSLF